MKDHPKSRYFLLVPIFLFIGWRFHLYPNPYIGDLFLHLLRFITIGIFFILAFSELGHFVFKFIGVTDSKIELGLGLGIFAWFLAIFNKIDIHFLFPLLLLVGLFLSRLQRFFKYTSKKRFFDKINTYFFPLVSFLFFFSYLIFFSDNEGFLRYSSDIDSNFHHIVLSQTIVSEGTYFSPKWLRAPFIPQLTHSLYIFVLDFFKNDFLYLKVFNFIAFTQIFILFYNRFNILSFFLLSIISFHNEFIYLYNTNLDALLALFILLMFYSFLRAMTIGFTFNRVFIIIIFAGLASGQKHFGMMFAFPVLVATFVFACLYFYNRASNLKIFSLYSISFLAYVIVSVPFYFHNILAGASLLFPFYGSKENNLGWSLADIQDYTGPTITHWGHRKDIQGFFTLPNDLIQFPTDFQFFQVGNSMDYLVSTLIVLPYFFLIISFIGKNRKHLIIPSVLILIFIFQWYTSSQVIRYLFPITLISLFILGEISISYKRHLPLFVKRGFVLCGLGIIIIYFLPLIRPIEATIPLSLEQRIQSNEFRNNTRVFGNLMISGQKDHSSILEIGPENAILRSQFPKLIFCGDWYGGCGYRKIEKGLFPLRLHEWDSIKREIDFLKFDFLSIYWTQFNGEKRPLTKADFENAIPLSIRNCIEPFYQYKDDYDIFKIKEHCK